VKSDWLEECGWGLGFEAEREGVEWEEDMVVIFEALRGLMEVCNAWLKVRLALEMSTRKGSFCVGNWGCFSA